MKRIVPGLIAASSVMCAALALAQAPAAGGGAPDPAAAGQTNATAPRSHSFHHGGGAQDDGNYIDRWLDGLKQRNPDEYAGMKKLRDENPDEFRRQLRQKLQEMRAKGGGGSLRDHPQVSEAINNLPPADRDWVMQRLMQPPPGGSFTGGIGMGFDRGGFSDLKHGTTPEIAKADAKSRDLAKKYREATTDFARNAAKQELRDTLANLFDLRAKTRADQLKQIEDKVAKIRKQIGDNKAKRDEIIDSRLKEMLGSDSKSR